MIKDLTHARGPNDVRAEVCIVGAGIAGLLLASRLRTHGLSVAVIESGPAEPKAEDPLNEVIQRGQVYRGATLGRSRGLGGTSIRWGGQLVPLRPYAASSRPYLGQPGWPVSPVALNRYLPDVEALFKVDDGAYDATFIKTCRAERLLAIADPDIQIAFSKAPSFRRRNVATILRNLIYFDSAVEMWLNATVTDFVLDRESGRIACAVARDGRGAELRVTANNFVIAAGAIEATRMLLALDAAHDHRVFQGCDVLGRYFHDHLSTQIAEFKPVRRRQFNRAFGHRFVGATMRHARLELTPTAQIEDGVSGAYAHVAMETTEESAFALLRSFLLARQKSGVVADPRLLIQLMAQIPQLASIGLWRCLHRQLYWAKSTKIHLHAVVEQVPHFDNRILLAEQRDALGARMAIVDWRPRETESRTLASYARRFARFWERHDMQRLARLSWVSDPDSIGDRVMSEHSAGDVYHPAGSTRMGTDGRRAVVDEYLRAFAVENLFVGSTSVFPTLTTANPTLTLMLLTLRLGDHLATLRR